MDENLINENEEVVKEEKAEKPKKDKNKKALEELQKLCDDYKDRWVRTAADFDNFKKRNLETRKIALQDGRNEIILKILPIGDNLQNALKLDLDENNRKGIELIARQFAEILKGLGVEEIPALNEDFNPEVHEAIMQVEGTEEQSGKVATVYLNGFTYGGKVLRCATVSVYK